MTWDPVGLGDPRPSGPRGKGGKQGRQAPGFRKIPPGVAVAVQAAALEGQPQAEIARQYGVSRWYVKRLSETVAETDPDQVAMLKKRLPQRLTILGAALTEDALQHLEHGNTGAAIKATFGAKLAVEANRWAQPAADNPGEQLLQFIAALQVNVTVNGTPAPETVDAESVVSDRVLTEEPA